MKMDEQWEVVTTGNVRFGMDPAAVAANLHQRFKLSDTSIARLLDGKQKTLKKGLDGEAARKYEAALASAGVTVRAQRIPLNAELHLASALSLEPMAGETTHDDPPTGQSMAPPPAPTIKPGQMQCPKCHAIQPKAVECRKCGLIIGKYTASSAAATAQPAVEQPGQRLPVAKITLGVVAVALMAIVYALFPKSSVIGTSPQAQAQERALVTAMSHKWPSPAEMHSLIAKGDYGTAERIIKYLQDRTLQDISWEDAYFFTVLGISPKNGYTEEQLNRWVATTHSTTAHLARGIYLQSVVQIESDNATSQISREQSEKHTRLSRRARVDIEKALERDPDLLPAYYALIWMGTVSDIDVDKDQLLSDAIEAAPGTLYVRNSYLATITPQWGGTYRMMEEFTDASLRYLDHNPRLWALQGELYAEQAEDAWHAEDYEKTVDLYAKALSFGVDRDWLKNSIRILEYLRRDDEVRDYVETMLQYFPWDTYAKEMKAKLAR